MPHIILCTLNARYIHASLGLRYLYANMGELQDQSRLLEFTINQRPIDIVEKLLDEQPEIIGFGIYIWNTQQTTEVIQLLKTVAPEIKIIIGGPEVTYEYESQTAFQMADYCIPGTGDLAFADTCRKILNKQPLLNKLIQPQPFSLHDIQLPYEYYTDEDIANRIIYVEASRGCPFKCEFCLSSLDKTVYPFDLDIFLGEMQKLFDRGVRSFKFIDRTFNLKIDSSIRIMEFFLQKMQKDKVYLHFELIPDHLPEKLREIIQRFPPHSLQFEIGIQTFNPDVQNNISRKQNNDKTKANLQWIRQHSHAHIHADLIIGLPGEDITSFAHSFDSLCQLDPHEIQVGILKRLKGTPIIRHSKDYGMHYSPLAPFNILSNELIDFKTMQRLNRFARYWDMIANSGRFKHSKNLLLGKQPFENFLTLSDWLLKTTGQTHKIALPRLFQLLYQAMTDVFKLEPQIVERQLLKDYQAAGLKGQPDFKRTGEVQEKSGRGRSESRQQRHMQ